MTVKTHKDFLNVIGGTHATARSWLGKQWNRYYHAVYLSVVRDLLHDVSRGTVLDVGTSHGHWYKFLKTQGFKKILGVELDCDRAALAREAGYHEVFNCDAADLSLRAESIDAAVSNDVFVHILRVEDKSRVLQKIETLLKPGGVFIVNCASSVAGFNDPSFRVVDYVSFMSLDDFITLIKKCTRLHITDIRPTYYHWRYSSKPIWLKALRGMIFIPGIPYLLAFIDRHYTGLRLGPDFSDAFYVKLRK